VGLFMAWVGPGGGAPGNSLSGWDLATKAKSQVPFTSKDPYILLAIGIVAVLIGVMLLAKKAIGPMRLLTLLAGVGVIAVHVRDYLSIKDVVKKTFPSSITIDFKIGFWLGIAGGVVLVVAALLPSKKTS
jgi:hypothetical protein